MYLPLKTAAFVAFAVILPLLIPATVLIVLVAKGVRAIRASRRAPGPMTYAEASSPLRSDLSLADKRELLSRVNGQRVRWSCTFIEAWERMGTVTALVRADGGGQVFFDPNRADRKRLEFMKPGMPLVVEGTVSVDIEHSLVTLGMPALRS